MAHFSSDLNIQGPPNNWNKLNRQVSRQIIAAVQYFPCYKRAINRMTYFFSHLNIQGPLNNLFFLKNALKEKLLNTFSNFFFYLKVQSFRLIMENNFIQMAASAGHAVAYTIVLILKHIKDCVQLYSTNGFMNI